MQDQTKFFRRHPFNFLTLLILLAGITSFPAHAQVQIRDTIFISPATPSLNKISSVQTGDSLVAPKSGILMIWPYEIEEISSTTTPPDAYVTVTVNNSVNYHIEVFPFFNDNPFSYNFQEEFFNSCTNQAVVFTVSGYMNLAHNFSNPPGNAFLLQVNKGDILNFEYQATYNAPLLPDFSDINDQGGSAWMEGYAADYSCWKWSNSPGDFCDLVLKYKTDISHTILLGGTKYYYATEDNGQLTIHETTNPVTDSALSGVTFDDPAAAAGSEKNPVYWEYQYPEYSGGKFVKMNSLPKNIIRLVGRYWEDGKTYKATLTAHSPYGKSASIDIEVSNPSSLGNTNQTVKDVFGNDENIDELLIKYAGLYGIPPQVLKADIDHESSFNPGYRWEPFVDAVMQYNNAKFMRSDFRYRKSINPDSEGDPGIPADHKNVSPIQYPQNDYSTIWKRLYDESETINAGAQVNRYPIRLWYQNPKKQWQKYYNTKFTMLTVEGKPYDAANSGAIAYANHFLEYKYLRGIMSTGIAQTRSAASYGLMQILYTTAVERHYLFETYSDNNPSHLPEYLNITETNLEYSVPYLLKLINKELVSSGDKSNAPDEWSRGFEGTIIPSLNMYNGKTATAVTKGNKDTRYNWHYGFDIINTSQNYLPVN